jgi:3,4-dihydroxy-9,10-secoandrosta-1,3,5(10)-triene-9,17-dione 4,5-dioxygenase
MGEVVACGYIGLSTDDMAAWRDFAAAVGMQVSADSTDDKLLLRIDDRTFRVCVEPGDRGVNYVGWEVAGPEALDALVKHLGDAGVETHEEPGLAGERGVERLVRCLDPAGNQLELFIGQRIAKEPFVSPTGARFITHHRGRGDLGFTHVVLSFEDVAPAQAFYVDLLGFRISDVALPHGPWIFTHVNPRHHSFAFGPWPGPSQYHHFMLEVENLDMVGAAIDRVTDLGAEITASLGKHTNDEMYSFYVRTPSGIELEYGFGGRLIDDDVWTSVTYEADSAWGHRPPAS